MNSRPIRKTLALNFLLITLFLTACDQVMAQSPADVLQNHLNAALNKKYEEAYSYISSDDKAVKNLDSYLEETSQIEDNAFAALFTNSIKYKIIDTKQDDEKADVIVEITMPDMSVVMRDIMGSAFASAFGGEDKEKQMEKMLAEKYKDEKIPLTTKQQTFKMIKEDSGWKVFLDWRNQEGNERQTEAKRKDEKVKQEKIAQLNEEAQQLKKQKKYDGAADKYEQILELDSTLVEAKTALEETKQEIEDFEQKQNYINNVDLYNLQAKYYQTYLDEKVPGVEFKIKNKGDKTLTKVVVTVYFKNSEGTIIAEESFHPVNTSGYSFSGNNAPLKPNYIWQQERGKFYKADSVPSEWAEGEVSAKITDIEFEE